MKRAIFPGTFDPFTIGHYSIVQRVWQGGFDRKTKIFSAFAFPCGEGGRAKGPDGCGAVRRTDLVPPLFRCCGGTFPQGKVRERPRREETPAGGSLPLRGRWHAVRRDG